VCCVCLLKAINLYNINVQLIITRREKKRQKEREGEGEEEKNKLFFFLSRKVMYKSKFRSSLI
jgi:hypothetical protein